MDLKRRDLAWLRQAVLRKTVSKVVVVGEIGEHLINEDRTDLICRAASLPGDGLEVLEDRFSFCSHTFLGTLIYPLRQIKPVYTRYVFEYKAIHSVYEDEEGRALIVLKDALLGN
jgi:hypothetical protein